jgi:putative peptidoglycan lipid II flippase
MSQTAYRSAFLKLFIGGFAGKILNYLTLAVVAYNFGGTTSTDILFLSISLTQNLTTLVTIFYSGIIGPKILECRLLKSDKSALEMSGKNLTWALIITLGLAVLMEIFAIPIFGVASKFKYSQLIENQLALRIAPAIFILSVLVEALRTHIQAFDKFLANAIISVANPTVTLVGIILISKKHGVGGVALSMLLGVLAQFCLQVYYLVHVKLRPILSLRVGADEKSILRLSLPLWLAHLITIAGVYNLDYYASGLQPGCLTGLVMAERIIALPIAILVMPIGETVANYFGAAIHANKNIEKAIPKALEVAIAITIPIAISIYTFRVSIVTILLSRGAYQINQAEIASQALGVLAFTIVTISIRQISARAFFALKAIQLSSLLGSIGFLLLIFATNILGARMGYIGLPSAKALVDYFYFVPSSLILLGYYVPKMNYVHLAKRVLQVVTCTALATYVAIGVSNTLSVWFTSSGYRNVKAGMLIECFIGIPCIIATYAVAIFASDPKLIRNLITRMPEPLKPRRI